jgi:AcrR family transcriptional regulator
MARALDPHKKDAIMAAARKIFTRDGFRAAKMTDIATEAGVAAGTLYLYFNSKDALSNAMSEDFFNRCAQLIDECIPRIGEENGLNNYVDAIIGIAREEMPVLSMARMETFEKAGKGREVRRELAQRTADLLQKLMDKGVIRTYNAVSLAEMMGGMLHKMIISCVVEDLFELDQHRATAVRMLEYALFENGRPASGN